MSRIGKAPIAVPDGVKVVLEGREVIVTGPQGVLRRNLPGGITLRQESSDGTEQAPAGGVIVVERPNDARANRALHGLTRALVANMVTGVVSGFVRELEIVGVGYRAVSKGPSQLELALGFSHPVVVDAPEGVTFEIPSPTRITVKGIDKEKVGQVAANIRKLRKPEPYKGKGIRYAGERVLRKAGKAAK
ncbi:MAG: 50S ribosomal protein L6 [Actinobacteria bacterium]|nr:50S ribosomal protein L6 [Actinomycetota bacterium]